MSRTRRPGRQPGAAMASSPWILVAAGVVVMVVLLVVALGSVRGRSTFPAAGPADPVMSLPHVPLTPTAVTPTGPSPVSATAAVVPGLSPRSTVLPARPTPAAPTPSPRGVARPVLPPNPPPTPPSAVTGRYSVPSVFDGGFIGEVLLVNTARTARGWTLRAVFPAGRLVTAWVEGAEQGVFRFDDGVFTYRSGFDLAPGQSLPVRFHIERAGTRPVSCTVDGTPCAER
ncbi:cellulose binding domain-containing protein [Micromonospora tulbaghiae]|uniref:Cellulose binding domain-containing protein n=1 Tax=Micromonospora tulbaghiae TaxID=479978 RepID=A0AAW4JQU8_9ACTN|nr:cellulose binding domain-containing protein [Micromonospora tulbaghiae]MBO4143869.1 cellulose binding domain-containing protein [Micromonospora tulbaghiae]MDX5461607.1 cellulose binding domain-containing protein [Micromonospora tulbaghiae]SCE86703.1 Cellulose binding domain-containing protein [Micromonospora tulbaghiae]